VAGEEGQGGAGGMAEMAAITAAGGDGALSPEEGQALAGILETQRRAIKPLNSTPASPRWKRATRSVEP